MVLTLDIYEIIRQLVFGDQYFTLKRTFSSV